MIKNISEKSLPGTYMSGDEMVDYKEIFIRPENVKGYYHLGLISLTFSSYVKAKDSYNRLKMNAQ